MRAFFLLPFCCAVSFAQAQPPDTEWLSTAGGFDQYTPNLSAVDPTGGIYTCGYGEEPRNYGGGVIVADSGFTIARYTAAGEIIWARPLTTTHGLEVYVNAIATNSEGDLWVAGYFNSATLVIDGVILTNPGMSSGFLARFDTNGDAAYAAALGAVGARTIAHDVCTDALDRVYVAGNTDAESLIIGSITVMNTAGGSQMLTLALDDTGVPLWATMSEAVNGGVEGLCIAIDDANDVFVATRFSTSLTVGTESVFTGVSAPIALVKLDPSGDAEWIHVVASCTALDLTADASGNAYVSGYIEAEADFDGTVLTPSVLDGFVSAYSAGGQFRWVVGVQGDIDNELCWSVELDSDEGSLIVGGTFVISASFGGIPISTGTSPTDGFVMHMDTSGTVNWVKDMTGDGPSLFAEAHFAADDHIIVSGTTQSQDTYLGEEVLNGIGNQAFLARFGDYFLGLAPGIDEAVFRINPNPCNGFFVLGLPDDARSVIISNALGREERRLSVIGMTTRALQIEEAGIHFVTVETKSTRYVQKLVVD